MKRSLFLSLLLLLPLAPSTLRATPLQGVDVFPSQTQRGATWAQWTAAAPGLVGDGIYASTWSQLEGGVSGAGLAYAMVKHKPITGEPANPITTPYVLELSLPMFPDQDTGGTYFYTISDRLNRGALGNYDSHWAAVANALVARGMGSTHIRLGSEFNLPAGTTLWSVGGASTAVMQDYANYWKKIRTAMMAVSGANFKFSWSALIGQDTAAQFTALTTYAYPGNSYVDYVSCDLYDASSFAGYYKCRWQDAGGLWSNQISDTQIQDLSWEELSTGVYRNGSGGIVSDDAGLSDYKAFADTNTRGFIISECGLTDQDRSIPSVAENSSLLNGGNNDDPNFIRRVYSWAATNSIYGVIYNEYCLQRKFAYYESIPNIVDHALLPNFWQSTAGADINPLYPQTTPHPRSGAAMLKVAGASAPASQLIPPAWKYVGSLKIPTIDSDWAFQTTTGSSPVYLASFPTIVRANVTGSAGNWKGICFLGTSAETGYTFEAYCGTSSKVPDTSPSSGPVFRVRKNGTQIWTSSKKALLGTMSYSGADWTTTAEEMSAQVTNDGGGGKRIKLMFGPEVIGEFSDSYGLTGRTDGNTYNGQALNGARSSTGDVKTTWIYEETFDDGDADGLTLSGWVTSETALHAPSTSGEKTATHGAFTDSNYTVACQIGSNVTGVGCGLNALTDASGNGYRIELNTKDVSSTLLEKNLLDTIKIKRTGGSSTVLATYTAANKVYMGQLQDLKVVTKDVSDINPKMRIKVYLNDAIVLDYTDVAPVSRAGKSAAWSASLGSAWIDNYISLPTITEQYPIFGMSVNPGLLQRAVSWGSWLNYSPQIIGDGSFATTWAQLAGSVPGQGLDVTIRKHKPGVGDPANPMGSTPYVLELGVPMFPYQDNSGTPYSSVSNRFALGASGSFDSYWTTLATNLVAKGLGETHLRLGWEFNITGSDNPWYIGGGTVTDMQAFANYWKKIHDAMMSVSGAHFQWSWCLLVGSDTTTQFGNLMNYAYPGDAYVDYVSCDIYDSSSVAGYYKSRWQDSSGLWSNQRSDTQIRDLTWEELLTGVSRDGSGAISGTIAGLQDYKFFADSHKKAFVISEAGIVDQERSRPSVLTAAPGLINGGNDDNPDFINRLYDWSIANEIYGLVYFEFCLQRQFSTIDSGAVSLIDHSLLPNFWNLATNSLENPIYAGPTPHPRSAAMLKQIFGGTSGIPSARKYVGSLEMPSMSTDSLFQTTTGSTAVSYATCPTIVKADVTGSSGNWKGICFLGTSAQVGYAFEAYCGASGVPSASPSSGPIWRVTKNGTLVWSSSRALELGTLPTTGALWSSTAQEMGAVVTNESGGGKRIKVMFGSDVIGEFSESYGLTGRTNGNTYNGQTLNGARASAGDVKTLWPYLETFDDGDADGFTLSGWTTKENALYAGATASVKTATRGAFTDSAYTVACQVALNTVGKSAGVNVLTASTGSGYRIELKSKTNTTGYGEMNVLDTIKLNRINGSTPTLLGTFTATDLTYMGQLQDLKIATSIPVAGSVLVKIYLNGSQVISYTDSSPTSSAGKSGPWAEASGAAWIDNYIQLPTP